MHTQLVIDLVILCIFIGVIAGIDYYVGVARERWTARDNKASGFAQCSVCRRWVWKEPSGYLTRHHDGNGSICQGVYSLKEAEASRGSTD